MFIFGFFQETCGLITVLSVTSDSVAVLPETLPRSISSPVCFPAACQREGRGVLSLLRCTPGLRQKIGYSCCSNHK